MSTLNPDWFKIVRDEIKKRSLKRENVVFLGNMFKSISYLTWINKIWIQRLITSSEVKEYIENIDMMEKGEYDFIWKNGAPVTVFPYNKVKKKK